uniref:SUEL-type lectin domain-containing protein n=1 Tax=Anopheles maculatus TaxID=74869 RepID=A0A182T1R0_9DIPT
MNRVLGAVDAIFKRARVLLSERIRIFPRYITSLAWQRGVAVPKPNGEISQTPSPVIVLLAFRQRGEIVLINRKELPAALVGSKQQCAEEEEEKKWLLSSTLRAFRTICCDDELLSLSCPIGTSISVELVQYGAKAESNETVQCAYSEVDSSYYPPEPTSPALSTIDFSVAVQLNVTSATPTASTPSTELATNDTLASLERPKDKCTPLYVLQYSILQTVVEACQKKRRCRIQATPKNFATAPCPGIHRMVEVNHKCRPFEFRSLISCEKDIVRLTCGQYTRIAIYSATYGRTAYESSHCSQTAASKEQTCLSEHTSHTLTEICQGRRKCTVAVESSTFGNPCPENIRVYLKVIYAC